MIHIQNNAQILSGLYTAVENNPITRTYAIISRIGTQTLNRNFGFYLTGSH